MNLNVPNILTILRIIMVPFFGLSLYNGRYITALLLFVVSGITDFLDGMIARKFNLVTSWGKLADPLADKLTQTTALVILTITERIPLPILIVVVIKEIFLAIGSFTLLKRKNHVVSSNKYGKLATVVFYVAVALVIMFEFREPISGIIVGVAIIPTLIAFYIYIKQFRKIRDK